MLPAKTTGIGSIFADPFRDFEQRWGRLMSRLGEDGGTAAELTASYPVDIDEDDEHIYVEAELPGFKPEEIDVSMESGMLTIQGERSTETAPKERTKHLSERRYTRVQRSFSLPNTVNEESVDAKLEGGVLHITLNKRPETKRRKIQIQGAQ